MPRDPYGTGRARGATDDASVPYASIRTNFCQKSTSPFPSGSPRNNLLGSTVQAWPGEDVAAAEKLPSITMVAEGLCVGNPACVESEVFLREMGITAVITVLDEPVSTSRHHPLLRTIPLEDRLFLRASDTSTQDMIQFFPGVCNFIDRRLRPHLYKKPEANGTHARNRGTKPESSSLTSLYSQNSIRTTSHTTTVRSTKMRKSPHRILIHCRQSLSRSATLAVAYLMYRRCKDDEATLAAVQKRCRVWPSPAFREQLRLWWDVRFRLYCDDVFRLPCEAYDSYRARLSLERAMFAESSE